MNCALKDWIVCDFYLNKAVIFKNAHMWSLIMWRSQFKNLPGIDQSLITGVTLARVGAAKNEMVRRVSRGEEQCGGPSEPCYLSVIFPKVIHLQAKHFRIWNLKHNNIYISIPNYEIGINLTKCVSVKIYIRKTTELQ